MMKPSLVLVLVLVAAPAAAQVPPAKALDATEQPIVKLGLFASKPDGSPSSAAYSTSDFDFGRDNQVYVSPCSMGASSVTSHVPTLAVAAWRTNGQVLQSSEGVAQVRVTWQRLRAAGRGVNEPPNVIDVTITPTDATTLDQVTLPEMGQCKPVTVRLQARYEPRLPASVRALMAPVVGGGAGRVAAGGSAGTGGGGVNVGSAAGAAAGSGGGGIRPIINRPGGVLAVAGAGGGSSGALMGLQRAELWLVHSRPGRPDEVLMTTTLATSTVADFSFAPMTIQSTTGAVTVQVTGTVELGRDMSGTPKLVFGASRRATFTASARQPRDGGSSVESGGVASTIVAVPGPEEVLSFEMPPLQGAGLPTVPDKFAIRLRLSPTAR